MKNTIRNLLFLSVLFFSISYDACTLGVDYDQKYKIYPEYDGYSCTFSKVYGQRWRRLGFATFAFGTALVISAVVSWRGKKASEDLRRSILIKEE
jgi:hypothetical protein